MRSRPFSWARILTAAAAVGLTAAFVVAAPRASAFGSYPTPAIAVAGSNTVIATQTSGDGLRFYWNVHGSENLAYFGYSDGSEGNLMFAWEDSQLTFHEEVVAPAGVN